MDFSIRQTAVEGLSRLMSTLGSSPDLGRLGSIKKCLAFGDIKFIVEGEFQLIRSLFSLNN